MRISYFLPFIFFSCISFLSAHGFQQELRYRIQVRLDDERHILRAHESIWYTNNSGDTLTELYFHLWPNAYKNDGTAFCTQEVENKKTDFYYSKEKDRGYIDSLDFRTGEEILDWSYWNEHEDIILIRLNKPLYPGQQTEIHTPFRVKIPSCFSRLGHAEKRYQISQWYPKPAVYDQNGWHPMPYLDQGEFYSEFAEFEVHIEVPEEYIVAATGDLDHPAERIRLDSLIQRNARGVHDSIPHSGKTKILTFRQKQVHDFAWVADPMFEIERETCSLPSGRTIQCYSYFRPEHRKLYKGSSKIIAEVVRYLSSHVGEYPYQQVSIADASLEAGGGMEYPNLAIIGPVPTRSELQTVIIHEVGHNWFYGILGSNERDYPWMDEGINSYYEEKIDNYLKKKDTVQNVKRNALSLDPALLYVLSARMHTDQGLNEAATAYTPLNYASVVYQKGGAMMRYLNSYLGDSAFDRSMKTYYGQWKFKHPRPGDLETCFKQTNASSLDWFFQDAVHTTRTVDAQIRSVQYKKESKEYRIHIHHPGSLKGPVPVSAFFKDSLLATRWIEAGKDQCVFTEQEIPGVDRFELNSMKSLPEMRFSNNDYRLHSLFHRWKPALRVGTSVGLSQKNRMYLLPALGYNVYDGFQGGLVVHNLEIPNHRLQVILNPMYAWNSKQWTGSGMLSYTFYPANKAEINTGLFFRSYHDRESHLNLNHSLFTRYYRFKPFAAIYFKKKNARSPIQDILQLQWSFVKKEAFQYRLRTSDSVYIPSVIHAPDQNAAQARFIHAHRRTFNPFQYEVYALANRNFLKLGLDTRCRIDYQMKNKSFYVRFFAGKYIQWQSQQSIFEERLQYLNLTPSGPQDLFYDETYAGRNESTGFFSKQISMREGGFKFSTRNYSDPVGTTNRWLTALNLRSDLPVKMPIHLQVFFDAATYAGAAEKNSSKQKVVYEAGLECHFFRDMLVIYAPLLLSRDLKDYLKNTYTKNRFAESLSFSLNLQQIAWFRTQHALSLIRF